MSRVMPRPMVILEEKHELEVLPNSELVQRYPVPAKAALKLADRGYVLDDGQDCGPPWAWQSCDWSSSIVTRVDLYVARDCPHCPKTVRLLTQLRLQRPEVELTVIDAFYFAQAAARSKPAGRVKRSASTSTAAMCPT